MKQSVQEQVAKMTEEEKDNLLRIGKIINVFVFGGGIPLMILALLGLLVIIDPPLGVSALELENVYKGMMIVCAIAVLYLGGILLFVKLKHPDFSDAKVRAIKKERKAK